MESNKPPNLRIPSILVSSYDAVMNTPSGRADLKRISVWCGVCRLIRYYSLSRGITRINRVVACEACRHCYQAYKRDPVQLQCTKGDGSCWKNMMFTKTKCRCCWVTQMIENTPIPLDTYKKFSELLPEYITTKLRGHPKKASSLVYEERGSLSLEVHTGTDWKDVTTEEAELMQHLKLRDVEHKKSKDGDKQDDDEDDEETGEDIYDLEGSSGESESGGIGGVVPNSGMKMHSGEGDVSSEIEGMSSEIEGLSSEIEGLSSDLGGMSSGMEGINSGDEGMSLSDAGGVENKEEVKQTDKGKSLGKKSKSGKGVAVKNLRNVRKNDSDDDDKKVSIDDLKSPLESDVDKSDPSSSDSSIAKATNQSTAGKKNVLKKKKTRGPSKVDRIMEGIKKSLHGLNVSDDETTTDKVDKPQAETKPKRKLKNVCKKKTTAGSGLGRISGVTGAAEHHYSTTSEEDESSCGLASGTVSPTPMDDDAKAFPARPAKASDTMIGLLPAEQKKFLQDFNPRNSARVRRKKDRVEYYDNSKITKVCNESMVYDGKGRFVAVDRALHDVCDCLQPDCPGCHFPCPKCRSAKCGAECRVNRKWFYERCDVEGTEQFFINKLIKT